MYHFENTTHFSNQKQIIRPIGNEIERLIQNLVENQNPLRRKVTAVLDLEYAVDFGESEDFVNLLCTSNCTKRPML